MPHPELSELLDAVEDVRDIAREGVMLASTGNYDAETITMLRHRLTLISLAVDAMTNQLRAMDPILFNEAMERMPSQDSRESVRYEFDTIG